MVPMVKIFLAAVVVALVTASTTAGAVKQNCATLSFTVSTASPASIQETCQGTITVNVRINGHAPYASQSFGKGNAGLIQYGSGAVIRLYQGGQFKRTLWVRATTAAMGTQHITIRFKT